MIAISNKHFCKTHYPSAQVQERHVGKAANFIVFYHKICKFLTRSILDSDVLLAILKQTLPLVPNLTAVLMSGGQFTNDPASLLHHTQTSSHNTHLSVYTLATMDADRFGKYFGGSTPRMHIPGFTHPVRDFTLEDVLEMMGYIPPKKNGGHVKRNDF